MHGRSEKACVCEAVGKRGGPEQRHGKEVAGRGSESGGLAQKIAEAARLEGDAGRLLECGPRRRKDSPERHVGKEAEHDEGEQRAQVAAAGAREVAAGTAAGEHHAEAEHQPAQDMPRPVETGAGEVHGLVERDHAACLQQLGANERRGAGQDPGAESPPVAEVVHIRQRAHGAEVGGEHHGAEQAADHQPTQRQIDGPMLCNGLAQRFDHRGSFSTAILLHRSPAICSAAAGYQRAPRTVAAARCGRVE